MTKICDFPYPIYDLTTNLIPYLWPKRLINHTLWGRTYLYSPYKGVPPPRPLTWPDHVQIYWKERKEFNSYRIGFLHHHAHRCIVLKNQFGRRDVNWKRSITSDCADVTHCSSYSETSSRKVLGEGFYLFVLAFVLFLTEFVILPHTDKLVHLNIVHRVKWIWIPANIKRANRYTKIYVGRSTTVHNLSFCS